MKALLTLVLIIALTSCANSYDKKYMITDSNGVTYNTDAYQQDGNCITFFADCGCPGGAEKGYVLCGSFSIEESK